MATIKKTQAKSQSALNESKKLSKMGEYLESGKPFLKGVEYDMALVLQ